MSFLQRIQLYTSFDVQFYIAQHLPNESNLQAQVRIPYQENTAVISSTVSNKYVLAFQHIINITQSITLHELYNLKGLSELRYFNPFSSNSVFDIWKKNTPMSFFVYYISVVNCRITYCSLENKIIVVDCFSNVPCPEHSLDCDKASTKELQ